MQGKRGNLQESYQLFVLRFLSFELKDQKESQEMAKWKFSKRWWEQIKRAIFLVMLFKEMEFVVLQINDHCSYKFYRVKRRERGGWL